MNRLNHHQQDVIEQDLQLLLNRPHMFGPPLALEFSFVALLDTWMLLSNGQSRGKTWRKLWQVERTTLHGAAGERFLSAPLAMDSSLFLTYATEATLNQSYHQVVTCASQVYDRLRAEYHFDNGKLPDDSPSDQLRDWFSEALQQFQRFGQPDGLEAYVAELLRLLEMLSRSDCTPKLVGEAWHEWVEKLTVAVPLHIRRARDTLSVQERSLRERAIPPFALGTNPKAGCRRV